jgi:hypothetical protein
MPFSEVLQRFVVEAPFAVMTRGLLENAFAPTKMDALFDEHAQAQSTRTLLFSSACEIMSWVVCRIRKSVNASCKHLKKHDRLPVSVDAVYDKLARVETQTSRALVRHSASQVRAILAHLGCQPQEETLLPGYDVRVVDGNHPESTQHRIGVLRDAGGGALPGVVVAVLDPQARLIEDVALSEDAYAQECTLFDSILQEVRERQLWVADRHYCTSAILFGIQRRKARFLIRQHAGHLRWELVGERRWVGRTTTGEVYEQQVRLTDPDSGERMTARRITVELYQATRDKDEELHLLSDVPQQDATALALALLYLQRWRLETAFQTLTVSLNCEPNTLGYPPAALFAFCVAVGCYNLLGAMLGAVRAAHGLEEEAKVSSHAVADELSMTYRGLDIAVPAADWEAFRSADAAGLAGLLREMAGRIEMKHYHKYPSRPRKTPRKPRPKSPRKHSSTHRLLNPHLYKDKDDT